MWLVVYKQGYYPSVFECETEQEAKELFDKLKVSEFIDPNDDTYVNNDGKLYMAEIKKSKGTNSEDVDWYLNVR